MNRIVVALLLALTCHIMPANAASGHVKTHDDARPHAWCGWYMRHQVAADPGIEFNQARQWAHYGAAVAGPVVGAIVVWPHHVGMITGRAINGLWMVHSGNDGHQVRTRARSVAGAIAFRLPANSIVTARATIDSLSTVQPTHLERGQFI